MGRAEDLYNRIKDQGERAINELIETRQSEELFLDFKRSSDAGSKNVLHDHDRNNLSKAISGFGNTEGGVIVWGVDCSRNQNGADLPRSKALITDVSKFRSWLEGVISGCTMPPHTHVVNSAIPIGKQTSGFVITLIPKSENKPHQDLSTMKYYIRAGSNFSPTGHSILEAMFGRQPQPSLAPRFICQSLNIDNGRISGRAAVFITNSGPRTAKDVYVNVFIEHSSENISFGMVDLQGSVKRHEASSNGLDIKTLLSLETRISPQQMVYVMRLSYAFEYPSDVADDTINITLTTGCDGSPPKIFQICKQKNDIENFYASISGQQNLTPVEANSLFDQYLKFESISE